MKVALLCTSYLIALVTEDIAVLVSTEGGMKELTCDRGHTLHIPCLCCWDQHYDFFETTR